MSDRQRLWLRVLSLLVPRWRRADWQREWSAELQARSRELEAWRAPRAEQSLQDAAGGMFRDALWLRFESLRDGLWLDLRLAARHLIRRPLGSLLVASVVAASVAVSVMAFVLVDRVLLQPLPFPDANALVRISQQHATAAPDSNTASRADLKDLRESSRGLSHVAGYYRTPRTVRTGGSVRGGDPAEVLSLAQVSADFFQALGVEAQIGRTFTAEETAAAIYISANAPRAADPRILLTHAYWLRRFAGDPDVVGSRIDVDRRSSLIVGVLPEWFVFPDETVDAFLPWSFDNAVHRDQRYLEGLGRLAPGWSLEAVQDEVSALDVEMARRFPDSNKGWTTRIEPLGGARVAPMRGSLVAGSMAVLAVLCLALLDIGMLQWVRAQVRIDGLRIRRALGASRGRVARTIFLEMALPSALGALVAGGLVAWWMAGEGLDLTLEWLLLPKSATVAVGEPGVQRTFLFWAATAGLAMVAAALIPAWRAAKLGSTGDLVDGGSRVVSSARRMRAVDLAVVTEIALATGLVCGSSLLLASWWNLTRVDPGFRADHVFVAPMILDNSAYDGAASRQFHEELRRRLGMLPGVESVASSTVLPMAPIGPDFARPVMRPGADRARDEATLADIRMATPELFPTLRIPLLAGRDFETRDNEKAEAVVVLSRRLADRMFEGGVHDAVGRDVVIDYSEYDLAARVVGVVENVRQSGLQGEPRAALYIPHAQRPYLIMNLAIRVDAVGGPDAHQLQEAILEIDPDQPPHSVRPLTGMVSGSIQRERITGSLVAAFGGAALALAALGLYGVLASAVSARRPEWAMRLALGARPRDLEVLVLGRAARLVMVGLPIGIALALGFGRTVSTLLYGVTTGDPGSLVVAVTVISFVAVAAAWLPARRAGRESPRRLLNS